MDSDLQLQIALFLLLSQNISHLLINLVLFSHQPLAFSPYELWIYLPICHGP